MERTGLRAVGETNKDHKVLSNDVIYKKTLNWKLLGGKPAALKDKIKNISLAPTGRWEFVIVLNHV